LIMECTWLPNRILYHDTAEQKITETPPCFTVGTSNSQWNVLDYPTEYCTTILLNKKITETPPCFTVGTSNSRWNALDYPTEYCTTILLNKKSQKTPPCFTVGTSNSRWNAPDYPTESCTTILLNKNHRTSAVFHCWNQEFPIVSFVGCSPNVNSFRWREQREGRLIWP
jgi:hypothetical protein